MNPICLFAAALSMSIAITQAAFAQVEAKTKDIPGVERVLSLAPSEGNPRNSEGDFIQLKDGRILFVYTHFTGSDSDHGAAHLAGRFSEDRGKTWTSEDTVILSNEGGMNVMSVSLLRLRTGEIALFYLRKNSTADCRVYMRTSTDEAKTWSEPILCIEPVGYYVMNNDRVIQLASGRLVAPVACHSTEGSTDFLPGKAMCFLSDDNGKTWFRSETVLDGPEASKSGLQEPAALQVEDGRVMMLCRTDQGCQLRSWSEDGGVTWSPVEPTNIMSPVSPATLERIPKTGDILLAWNDHGAVDESLKGWRTPFTVAVSRDSGQTWEHAKNLEDDPDGWFCYTAMEFVDDSVLLAYCAGNRQKGGLNATRVIRVGLETLYR